MAEPQQPQNDDSESEVSSEEEDDDLILEGALIRNTDVPDSDDESEDQPQDQTTKELELSGKRSSAVVKSQPRAKKVKTEEPSGPEVINVDFTFHDMNENFFHGLKTLLTSSSPLYTPHSSGLSDLMIENVSVGTVVSTEGDQEGTVFGFASVLNVTTYQEHESIKALKKMCLDKCPSQHRKDLETVLSGTTKRPAGIFLQARMVNLPLEVVEVLHQQLVLDMDWAVQNASGGEAERKALDFGAFLRIAPSFSMGGSSGVGYKYFEDEIFASNAEFSYNVVLPKSFGMEEAPHCTVIVLTKTGHRDAMKEMARLVGSAPST